MMSHSLSSSLYYFEGKDLKRQQSKASISIDQMDLTVDEDSSSSNSSSSLLPSSSSSAVFIDGDSDADAASKSILDGLASAAQKSDLYVHC